MRKPPLPFFPLAALSAILGSGCGQFAQAIKNDGRPAPVSLAQTNTPPDAGVPSTASATITPSGKDLAVISVSPMRGTRTTTSPEKTNDITISAALLSETSAYATVHQHEINTVSAADSVYSLDSAVGCQYALGTPSKGQTRAPVTQLSGSCVDTLTLSLPNHDVPRAFFNLRPLFSTPIALADLKTVAQTAPNNPSLSALFQTYISRLGASDRTLTVADVATFLPLLGDDSARIQTVVLFAPHVSNGADATTLSSSLFTNAANYTRAVKILQAYR